MPGWAHELEGRHTPETEAYGINSFVLRSHDPLHPQRFADFMEQPFTGLLRAKGYIWLASRTTWVVSYSRTGNVATHEPIGHPCRQAVHEVTGIEADGVAHRSPPVLRVSHRPPRALPVGLLP